ncbi:MAG TPA: hypothetical protein VKG79_07795 [Bryobacteraceae bacterium]|nr:hypothetical protein [Bryobacteraceae bacterium]
MDSLQTQFDQAYLAAQPPEIQALMAMDASSNDAVSTRVTQGAALAAKGFLIDVPIMIYAWDAYLCMTERQDLGMTWVPSALMPGLGAANGYTMPGIPPQPGQIAYDPANPPPGAIKVSTSPADYAPFDPPAPPPPTPVNSDPVGPQSVGNLYLSTPLGNTYPDGAMYTEARGTFLKHVTITPFGRTHYWEKVS